METVVRVTAVLADRSRNGTRVAEAFVAADARSDGRPGARQVPPPPSRALVALEPRIDPAGYGRPQPSVPFLTQLAGGTPGLAGERRSRRDPAAVAPRAAGAYRSTGRLTSDLEPGFIVVREV